MPKQKPVSGIKVVKALSKAGFQVVGRKGSHVRLNLLIRTHPVEENVLSQHFKVL